MYFLSLRKIIKKEKKLLLCSKATRQEIPVRTVL